MKNKVSVSQCKCKVILTSVFMSATCVPTRLFPSRRRIHLESHTSDSRRSAHELSVLLVEIKDNGKFAKYAHPSCRVCQRTFAINTITLLESLLLPRR